MAANRNAMILGVALIGGVLLYSLTSSAETEKKPELPPEEKAKRTKLGDKGEAVKAWQRVLIAAGCLAAGEDDGIHGEVTEQASVNYAAGKCTTPLSSKKAAAPKVTDRYWYLTNQQTTNPSAVALLAKVDKSNRGANVRSYFENWAREQAKLGAKFTGPLYVYSSRTDTVTADVKLFASFVL